MGASDVRFRLARLSCQLTPQYSSVTIRRAFPLRGVSCLKVYPAVRGIGWFVIPNVFSRIFPGDLVSGPRLTTLLVPSVSCSQRLSWDMKSKCIHLRNRVAVKVDWRYSFGVILIHVRVNQPFCHQFVWLCPTGKAFRRFIDVVHDIVAMMSLSGSSWWWIIVIFIVDVVWWGIIDMVSSYAPQLIYENRVNPRFEMISILFCFVQGLRCHTS